MDTFKHTAMVLEFDKPNLNRRVYPSSLAKSILKQFQDRIDNPVIGMLDNPSDSVIHFAMASHLVTRLWVEQSNSIGTKPISSLPGSKLMCEVEVLDTPCGQTLRSLLKEHPESVAFRPMGVGSGTVNPDGVLVIGEGYKFITINAIPAHEAS
jgi:hypothetical protein